MLISFSLICSLLSWNISLSPLLPYSSLPYKHTHSPTQYQSFVLPELMPSRATVTIDKLKCIQCLAWSARPAHITQSIFKPLTHAQVHSWHGLTLNRTHVFTRSHVWLWSFYEIVQTPAHTSHPSLLACEPIIPLTLISCQEFLPSRTSLNAFYFKQDDMSVLPHSVKVVSQVLNILDLYYNLCVIMHAWTRPHPVFLPVFLVFGSLHNSLGINSCNDNFGYNTTS